MPSERPAINSLSHHDYGTVEPVWRSRRPPQLDTRPEFLKSGRLVKTTDGFWLLIHSLSNVLEFDDLPGP
jgi:hypothetical protein